MNKTATAHIDLFVERLNVTDVGCMQDWKNVKELIFAAIDIVSLSSHSSCYMSRAEAVEVLQKLFLRCNNYCSMDIRDTHHEYPGIRNEIVALVKQYD